MEKKYEAVMSWLISVASDEEVMEVINEVDSWNGSMESWRVYQMEELNDLFYGVKPLQLLEKLADGFDVSKDYFHETVYGLESCDLEDIMDDVRSYANEIAEKIIEAMDETSLCLPDSLQELIEEK